MSLYEFGPFQLDAESLLLLHGGEPVALGPKVVATLLALIECPGEVHSKDELLDRVWPEGFVEESNLTQNVHRLRKILRESWGVDAIRTVPRRGYRFVEPVSKSERVKSIPIVVQSAGVQPPAARSVPPPSRRGAAFAAALLVFMSLAIAAFAFVDGHHKPLTSSTPALSANGARLYEIGRYYWNLRTRSGIEKSISYFKQVIDSDPQRALGYAALAEATAIKADYHYGPSTPAVYFSRAQAYAEKALSLDPNSAEAHATLGLIAMDRGKHDSAATELQHSLALNPKYGPAHEWYALVLLHNGRRPDAEAELRISANLDPLSVATTAWLGSTAYLDHRFNDAISYSREALEISPQNADANTTMGFAYEARGQYDRAIDAFKHVQNDPDKCWPESAAAYLAQAYALEHRMPQARSELAYAVAHRKNVAPEDLAVAYAATGHKAIAFGLLRRVRDRMTWTTIAIDPRFSVLRNDVRYRQMIAHTD